MIIFNFTFWIFVLETFHVFGMRDHLKILAAASTGIRAGPPARCHFRQSVFRQGDAWHTKIQQSGHVYCLTCHCYKEGREQCRSQRCPKACQLSPACCPICDKTSDLDTEDGTCIYDGVVYRDGESFAISNGTFAYSAADQCIQCICQDTNVLCDVLNCSKFSCLEKAQMPSQCCPHCKKSSEPMIKEENLEVPPTPFSEEERKGCRSGGRWYEIGTKWRPMMGPFGPLPCVECLCTETSKVKCHRLLSCNDFYSSSSRLPKETSQLFNEVADEASPLPLPESIASAEVIFRCVSEARQLLAYNSYLGKTNITELYEMVFNEMISRRSNP